MGLEKAASKKRVFCKILLVSYTSKLFVIARKPTEEADAAIFGAEDCFARPSPAMTMGYFWLSVNLYPTPRMEWKYTGFF